MNPETEQLRERVRQNREALSTMFGVKPPQKVTSDAPPAARELQLTPPRPLPKGEMDV